MISNNKQWKNLFLFGLGLTIGTAFCMKWMEKDLWVNGEKFSIMGLELFYPRDRLMAVLAGLDDHVKVILRYHLSFDFAFMAGVYPGIAAVCMLAKGKVSAHAWKRAFISLALLQIVAWGFDIAENYFLLKWIALPAIGNEFVFYHFLVAAKWIIALTAVLIALPVVLRKRKKDLRD